MRALSFAEVTALRQQAGRSALLYLTDRCPVGCAHCSVDARRGGPAIRWPLFTDLVGALARMPALTVVGISGGEPFAERRALTFAAGHLTQAGKHIVPYTSGYWGARDELPAWITAVLGQSSCVVLSTDRYHQARVPDLAFTGAARAIAARGVPIACQVIDEPAQLAAAAGLLATALGGGWRDCAELVPAPLLPAGRAKRFRIKAPSRPGPCRLACSPVVRYDGRVTACCNEAVVTGAGPAHLRRTATGDDLAEVLDGLAADPYVRAISAVGPAVLAELTAQDSDGFCDTCWRLLDRGAASDPRIAAVAALTGARR